jgi:hypothetical protein
VRCKAGVGILRAATGGKGPVKTDEANGRAALQEQKAGIKLVLSDR